MFENIEHPCVLVSSYICLGFTVYCLLQILERDGTDIVSPDVQRYVNPALVHFVEEECGFIVVEGIHRVIVSLHYAIWYMVWMCQS